MIAKLRNKAIKLALRRQISLEQQVRNLFKRAACRQRFDGMPTVIQLALLAINQANLRARCWHSCQSWYVFNSHLVPYMRS